LGPILSLPRARNIRWPHLPQPLGGCRGVRLHGTSATIAAACVPPALSVNLERAKLPARPPRHPTLARSGGDAWRGLRNPRVWVPAHHGKHDGRSDAGAGRVHDGQRHAHPVGGTAAHSGNRNRICIRWCVLRGTLCTVSRLGSLARLHEGGGVRGARGGAAWPLAAPVRPPCGPSARRFLPTPIVFARDLMAVVHRRSPWLSGSYRSPQVAGAGAGAGELPAAVRAAEPPMEPAHAPDGGQLAPAAARDHPVRARISSGVLQKERDTTGPSSLMHRAHSSNQEEPRSLSLGYKARQGAHDCLRGSVLDIRATEEQRGVSLRLTWRPCAAQVAARATLIFTIAMR
jgi:hypothetical protein